MICWKRQREPGPVQLGEHHTQLTHTMGSSASHPWLCFLSSHFPPNLPAPWMWVSLQSCFLAVAPLPTCSSSPPPAGGGHTQWRLLGSYSQQGYHRAAWPHESWLILPLGPAGQNRAGSLSVRINQTGTRRLSPQGWGDPRPRLCHLSQERSHPPWSPAILCVNWPQSGLQDWTDWRGEMPTSPGKLQGS